MAEGRLTGLDASFLHLENGGAHMHVAGVMLFDGDPPAYEELVRATEARLHLVPRYRQKLAFVPFGQGRPRWLDDPHGQSMESAQFQLRFADGSERPVSVRVLPTKYFLKGGLYGGLNGWFHGDDRGKLYFEHDVWDLTDAHTRQRARTLADQVVEVRDGDEVGYGIIEYGVGKGFGQYESVQGHPPI